VVRVPAGAGNFSLHPASRPALEPDGYQGLVPWRQSGRGVKLTTHLHLVPRSRIHGAIPPLSNTSSWRGAQLKHRDFTFTFILSLYMGKEFLPTDLHKECRIAFKHWLFKNVRFYELDKFLILNVFHRGRPTLVPQCASVLQ
jgi:hypothetical protein